MLVRIDLHRFELVEGPGSQPAGLAKRNIAIDMSTHESQTRFIGRFQNDDKINRVIHNGWMAQAIRDAEVLLGWRGRVPMDAMEVLDDNFQAHSQSSSSGGTRIGMGPNPFPSPSPTAVRFCVGVSTG